MVPPAPGIAPTTIPMTEESIVMGMRLFISAMLGILVASLVSRIFSQPAMVRA